MTGLSKMQRGPDLFPTPALAFLQRGFESGPLFALALPMPKPNRSPAQRVLFGKEEGDHGFGVFPALTETGETEWSELLLTPMPFSAKAV